MWGETEGTAILQPWKGQEGKGIYCCLNVLHKRLQRRRQSQVFLRGAQGQERGNWQKSEHGKFWPGIRKNFLPWGWWNIGGGALGGCGTLKVRFLQMRRTVRPLIESDHQEMNDYTCNIKIDIRLQVWLKLWVLIKYRSKDGETRYTFFCHGKSCFLNKCVLLYWRYFKTSWI